MYIVTITDPNNNVETLYKGDDFAEALTTFRNIDYRDFSERYWDSRNLRAEIVSLDETGEMLNIASITVDPR
jgi:hypothetical protein